ncbi:hypothetical protein AALP_AA7G154100 [Arabis alpina]|uniref:Uncharacterized protein n=1 Tax=Arabis alpina TaxID=50452 RepID=A0A087GI88_ARAAL|nr:hypothetical protein AALP_AA7G154100 [Arabis alpina]
MDYALRQQKTISHFSFSSSSSEHVDVIEWRKQRRDCLIL